MAEADLLVPDFVTCGPVLLEVLQGLREEPELALFRQALLRVPKIGDPMPLETFLQAAEIYKDGRRRGYTIRSSMDCLIAAVAIEHGATIWHKDRDYDTIARFTPLRVVRSIR
jgi:predicted nucleic acid-binding protein